jgi:N-acetylmuramic acid 6-phosphate etherase
VILNGFSTALMVGLGRTYSNLMVSVLATNQKLRERTLRILGEISGEDEATNAALIAESGGDLKVAAIAALTEVTVATAEEALLAAGGSVREAVRSITER